MIGCLWTRVRKQPIIALYFEFENELKFYNLEAEHYFRDVFRVQIRKKSQFVIFCYPTAEHIRMPFGHFAKVLRRPVYTNPYFGGTPLKSVIS